MIIVLDKANEQQCKDMIDYFLSIHCCEEAVIKYTERLYKLTMQNVVTKMSLKRIKDMRKTV